MAETAAIAKMADVISQKIFEVFGWTRNPYRDLNFKCELKAHKKHTHPADVVFSYDSPHENDRIFINTDLKSYAKNSISLEAIKSAATSAILSMDCANRSPEWRRRYAGEIENYHVHGMLFIYNHDGEFDSNWGKILREARIATNQISATIKSRLYIIGPTDVQYLLAIADDITRERGLQNLPFSAGCKFFYPDLTIDRVKRNNNTAATIEVLTSPWMVLNYEGELKSGSFAKGSYCYYRGEGKSYQEFMFLIDYLFRTNLVGDSNRISIRCPFASSQASSCFEQAKCHYFSQFHSLTEFQLRLDRITFDPIGLIQSQFSQEVMGMEDHNYGSI